MDMNMKEYVNWKMSHDVKYGENKGYPLVLEDCRKNKELKDFKIYGNSVQNGTPTPDNPIEVESVGDLTTKNLFDYNSQNWVVGLLTTQKGVLNTGNSNYITTDYLELLEPGEVYTVSFMQNFITDSSTSNRICYYDEGKNFIKTGKDITYTSVSRYSYTLEVPTNAKYIRYSVRKTDTDIQIEIGDKATEYEPFHKYKIPVTARGKNLFDYKKYGYSKKTNNGLTCEHIGNGVFHLYGAPTASSGFSNFQYTGRQRVFKVGKKYKLSQFGTNTNRFYIYGMIGVFNESSFLANISSSVDVSPYTIPSGGCYSSYVQITYRHNKIMEYVDEYIQLQLEEETFTDTYEPYIEPQNFEIYLNEPLRKVRNYADYIDFENKKVIRKNKAINKFSSNQFVQYGNYAVNASYLYPTGVGMSIDAYAVMCSYDSKAEFSNIQGMQIAFALSYNGIDYKSETAMEEWTQLYDSWVESGKFLLQYALKIPIEEPIELPELPKTQAKTMIYEVIDTTIEPSNMYSKYVKKY